MGPAHALISPDTLIERGRVIRPPLRAWIDDLLARLAAAEAAEPMNWYDIASCMNNAALIEVYRGNRRSARELCDLQLRWLGDLIQVHGFAAVGELTMQPWVNIGRLLRIQGDYTGSLGYFSFWLESASTLQLGPITIDAAGWHEMVADRSIGDVLKAIYVVESTRSYFAAKDYRGALEFIAQARTRDDISPLAEEAEVIALAKLGLLDEAMQVTEQPGWLLDGYCKLVRVTYRVALQAASEPGNSARGLLEQLAGRVLPVATFDAPQDQRVLRYLHYLGALARHLAMDELAGSLWHKGLRAARHLGDVPLLLSFLESLLALDGTGDCGSLAEERAALLDTCLYTSLLASRGHPVEPTAADTQRFAELHQTLQRLAQDAAAQAHSPLAHRQQAAAAGAS